MCGALSDELILKLQVGLVGQLWQVTYHVATLNTEQSRFPIASIFRCLNNERKPT